MLRRDQFIVSSASEIMEKKTRQTDEIMMVMYVFSNIAATLYFIDKNRENRLQAMHSFFHGHFSPKLFDVTLSATFLCITK